MNHHRNSPKTLLVTGGAGFIGANFVLSAVADGLRVLNLDKLTYAGNLETLEPLKNDDGHRFVQGDIGDRTLVAGLLRAVSARGRREFRRGVTRRSFD